MKGIVAWFADNHVAANLLMFLLLIAGGITALTMKLEVFPETNLDMIVVSTVYPGASPSEVEEGILRPLEEAVAGLTGIKKLDSLAREGYGSITIEVIKDWDLKALLDEVKSAVDRTTTLPEEAEQPIVREIVRSAEVIKVAVYGDVSEQTLKEVAERLKDDLTALDEITDVDISGTRVPEIRVEIAEETLRRYNLTLSQVAQAIRRSSLDLPAGALKTSGGEILIRTKGRRYRAEDYADVAVLTTPEGGRVSLSRIAELKDGFEDKDVFVNFQGRPSVQVNIKRVAEQNALTVAGAVKKHLEKVRPTLPAGVELKYFSDRSAVLKSRMDLLGKNLSLGLGLVCLLLGTFLNWRLAFWVALGIPISFLAGIWTLPGLDISINMVSLFAFIMVLGIVVDDAIVVGEHVFYMREQGLPPLKAAIEGTVRIGRPVIFSVLTTVAAFWPLMMAGGTMGKIMYNIPVVVIVVLMASLVECLFILPAHLNRSRFKVGPDQVKREKLAARALKWVIRRPYQALLDLSLRWRYLTICLGLASLLLSYGLIDSGMVKFILFPRIESDNMTATLTMPAGTPVETTQAVVTRLEEAAREALAGFDKERPKGAKPLLDQTISLVGLQLGGRHASRPTDSGSHLGQVYIMLLEGEERDVSTRKLTRAWRQAVGRIPGVESLTFSGELFRGGNPVELHLSAEKEETLIEAAERLKTQLADFKGVFGIEDSFLPGKKELQLKLKETARPLGLTLNDLALQVRHAIYGAEALRFLRDKDEVKVMVRYPESERRSVDNIERMRIRTPSGDEVPFSQVAQVTNAQGYASIERSRRKRVIKVMADVDEDLANAAEIREEVNKTVIPELLASFPGLRSTVEGAGREQMESLNDVLQGFILALILIYTLLAVPFKSFSQPFIVMFAIPFGLVGAVAGHLIMGLDTSLMSLFGMVGLTGVVVNDSLVLIHAANNLRAEGRTAWEAIREAGPLRFRAIILTSLTTFAGLSPMLVEKSIQAQFLIPMAVSLGFGVLFATGVTLILIPCGYLILEDLQRIGRFVFGSRREVEET